MGEIDLPPGVTRYPLDASTHLKWRPASYYVVSALFALAFGVLGSFLHDSVMEVWATAAVAVMVGALLNLLVPGQLRLPFVVVFLLVGGGVNARGGDYVLPGLWIIFLGAGVILTQEPLRRRARAKRDTLAEGAPPARRDPRKHFDMGNMMIWVDGSWMYEAVDPSKALVLSTVRRLDGDHLSSIVVFNGIASLSIGGDARGEMAVVHIPDRNRFDAYALVSDEAAAQGPEAYTDPSKMKVGPRTTVRIAREDAQLHTGWVITDLAQVERAAAHFVDTADREPSATWHADTRTNRIDRPAAWTVFDV